MDESDQIASLSQEFAGEESSCNSTTFMHNASKTAQTPEISLSIKNCSNTATVHVCDINTKMLNDGCTVNSYQSKNVVNTCNITEGARCTDQACSSNDFHPVMSGRRGRQARKMTGSSSQNVANRFHGVTGRENNYSVWQKVQKINTEVCFSETVMVNAVSPQDDTSLRNFNASIRLGTSGGLKQNQSGKTCRNSGSDEGFKTDLCKVASNVVNAGEVTSELIDGNLMNNDQTKASSAFKQANHYSMKESYAAKVNMKKVSKNHVPQNGVPTLLQVNHDKHITCGLRSPCSTDFQQLLGAPAEKIDHCRPEPQQKTQNYIGEVTSIGNSYNTVCDTSLPAAYNDLGASPSNSLDRVYIEGTSDIHGAKYSKEELHHTGSVESQCWKLETERSHMECSKPDGSTGSVLQKCAPLGKKELMVSNTSHLDYKKVPIVEDLVHDKLDSRHIRAEVSTSNTQYFTHITRGGFACSSPRAEDKEFSAVKVDQENGKLKNQPYAAEESGGVLAVPSCQTNEVKNQGLSRLESDLDKILLAVHDSHKLHIAAGAHLASGNMLADFERFLYSASPVICQTHSIRRCWTCFKEQLPGDSLCLHQIPNISLKSLWQWYEEPGCFGLEVKAHDYHNSKKLRNGYSEFSAYFVPYLSAVQLFGRSRNTRNDSHNEVAIACEVEKTLETPSNLRSLPILSMLLPQPCNERDTRISDSSSFAEDEFYYEFNRSMHKGDKELIFEYFEFDQPPWRHPLFEKIKGLIDGDTSSNRRAFGDPLNLEKINLHDLHPASWYSVAWYPIYRIPDGNFHAAFLTYHSLGHFIHRSSSSNTSDGLGCVASPVVGLQTYNDKGECWFKLKESYSKFVQNEEAQFSHPSEILKERLRTLSQTATVMARASVPKGNQSSVNRHPDYEFFLSRRR